MSLNVGKSRLSEYPLVLLIVNGVTTHNYFSVLRFLKFCLSVQTALLLRAIRLLSRLASSAGDLQRQFIADTELLSLCITVFQSNSALWISGTGVELKFSRQ